jgi:hypothetical protein
MRIISNRLAGVSWISSSSATIFVGQLVQVCRVLRTDCVVRTFYTLKVEISLKM